ALDEDPTQLHFRQTKVLQGKSILSLDGLLDLGAQEETIALKIDLPSGSPEDLIHIFSNLTEDLEWFPRTLTGVTNGNAEISGGVDLSKLQVKVKLSGPEWEYANEKFRAVSLQGGYDRGKYYLESVKLSKQNGSILG